MGLTKQTGDTRGGGCDIYEIPGYYPHLGYSEEVFERALVQHVVPNQDISIIPYNKVFG